VAVVVTDVMAVARLTPVVVMVSPSVGAPLAAMVVALGAPARVRPKARLSHSAWNQGSSCSMAIGPKRGA